MKFKRNPSASPVFSKTSPTRQEVDPQASESEFQQIDIYNQLYNRQAPEIREDLGRKAKGAVTTIEKKNEGMQLVFDAIKSGADKEEITKIVREHNRDLYGSVKSGEVVQHKGFANARIGLKEAFSYIPESAKTETVKTETVKTPETSDAEESGYVFTLPSENLEYAQKKWGLGALSPELDKQRGDYYRKHSIWSSEPTESGESAKINNPIPKKGFKMPGFGKRK